MAVYIENAVLWCWALKKYHKIWYYFFGVPPSMQSQFLFLEIPIWKEKLDKFVKGVEEFILTG